MNQWHAILDQYAYGLTALAIGFVLFSMMENMFLLSPAKKPWRSTVLDLQYALLSMLFPPCVYFVIAAVFGWLALHSQATAGHPQIPSLHLGIQLLILLFARDCLIYLRHRIFHTRPVWAFHSIHHSSEEVNWISAVRFHPAESIIESSGEILLFLGCRLIGFDSTLLAGAGIFIGFYNYFIHSNLSWTFGPLRYVLVSPVFHRWHHSDAPEARDKNFAAMFSFIDLALGTFYMPKDVLPHTLGLSAEERTIHPRTLPGQLLYPFRKKPRESKESPTWPAAKEPPGN